MPNVSKNGKKENLWEKKIKSLRSFILLIKVSKNKLEWKKKQVKSEKWN